ncbi:2TM domain-containing protein [Tenacibaculum sp.]|uniref:2TM domain-containing protein n=1 Tax=Tenacibaculum sp. TaxID=1906242 RepID=UPI003D0B17A6
MKRDYIQERKYIRAKKKVTEIKKFYIHLFVTILSLVVVTTINILFVPSFYFFWYAIMGMLIILSIHWFMVFGGYRLGLGKDWEEKKIKELMREGIK